MKNAMNVLLGGKELEAKPLPWGQTRNLLQSINRIGMAVAAGVFDDALLDEMEKVLSIGYGFERDELQQMPVTLDEIQAAFEALIRATGLESAMDKALAHAKASGLIVASSPAG